MTTLEQILTAGHDPLPALRRLGDPRHLELLFRVEACAAVRTGPPGPVSPAHLLATAHRAAAAGALPFGVPRDLRRMLRRLGSRLLEAGAWDAKEAFWWSPLPPPSPAEQLWDDLCRLEGSVPNRARLRDVLTDATRRWLALPDLLPPSFTEPLHQELEAARHAGTLDLERAGVGADGRLSTSRSDSVEYLAGTEPDLPRHLAALVQWCLRRLGEALASALPGSPVFPPAHAMLARYPAPSGGYHAHLDNPGGSTDSRSTDSHSPDSHSPDSRAPDSYSPDNGRTLTLVLYLNGPSTECSGGEIALWRPGAATSAPPTALLPARGGSAVLFDSREVAHQVQPLGEGPARWALTLWFNNVPRNPPSPPPPEPSFTDVLLAIEKPPLPADTVLFHQLDDRGPVGEIVVRKIAATRPRVGIVSTVYGRVSGGGPGIERWCEHHLALGIDHLVLIFDHLEEPEEAAVAHTLNERIPPTRLTVWAGSEVASKRWPSLPAEHRAELETIARAGPSSHAVAARQTLHASAALEAARGDELGGTPLDWLIHLDADELFHLQGDGRGGATLHRHFAAATVAGLTRLRYLNHELLPSGSADGRPRFKLNPRLAAARLGPVGWSKLERHLGMAPTDPRPYFTSYFNGKSAVAVAAGRSAAGVHGWSVAADEPPADGWLAGPCVLHCHVASAQAFRAKYLSKADAEALPGPLPFEPSPVEVTTLERIRSLRRKGLDDDALGHQLDELHHRMTSFTDNELELLEEAGLLFRPDFSSEIG